MPERRRASKPRAKPAPRWKRDQFQAALRRANNADAKNVLSCWSLWANTNRHIRRALSYSSPMGKHIKAAGGNSDATTDAETQRIRYDTLEPHMLAVHGIIEAMPARHKQIIHLHFIAEIPLNERLRALGIRGVSTYYDRLGKAMESFLTAGGSSYT